MDFMLNDLSFHEQFSDIEGFRRSLKKLMEIRFHIESSGRNLFCERNVLSKNVLPGMPMPQAINLLAESERRSILSFLTKNGPFWEDIRAHSADDYLEHRDEVVTDTAVGEAAWCNLNEIQRDLVSVDPSNWLFTPVNVDYDSGEGSKRNVSIANHWDCHSVKALLDDIAAPAESWSALEEISIAKYSNLTFAADAFLQLNGVPFSNSASHRLEFILSLLNRYKTCFDANGERTADGHEIYQNFFTGKKGEGGRGAMISDSSDDEKNEFKSQMTFQHPNDPSKKLFCTWHGKVQTPQLRVHFSMPIRMDEPLYVVYVGPKLTIK